MEQAALRQAYYQAQAEGRGKESDVPYLAVKTTGIFCRPGCPARSPKPENCLFFATAEAALAVSFRPCKRCRPLETAAIAQED